MKHLIILLFSITILSCNVNEGTDIPDWINYDESEELEANQEHDVRRMRYKLIQSKVSDKNEMLETVESQLTDFSKEDYDRLKTLIYDKNIPEIQMAIDNNDLTYKKLTQWYLYRIGKYESDSMKTLHTVLAINPNAVKEAKALDKRRKEKAHQIYGMPILLKDNINTSGMRTTAGALALSENQRDDAFIVERLKSKGAIILGKVNLSEWAYFFCSGCPVGYSAIGGQTLNPYGRMQFETGGSSSGSGTSIAANYAVAAVGTETSGSILSPSSQNSLVGLKPTIGLLSRSGIVPISSTLDTPGPMTKSVVDNAILLSAMVGKDKEDSYTEISLEEMKYWEGLDDYKLDEIRLGANKQFLERDSIYRLNVEILKEAGAQVIEFDPVDVELNGFLTLLNIDMKHDLPKYLEKSEESVVVRRVKDVVEFNLEDTLIRAPYGQALFEGIVADTTTLEQLEQIKKDLRVNGRKYFDEPMGTYDLDAILSINNWNAGVAAVAHYPCLTVPMGYKDSGEPINMTFIGRTLEEEKLLKIAFKFEMLTKARRSPIAFED